MKNISMAVAAMLAVALAASLCQAAADDLYYPLKPGLTWQYKSAAGGQEAKKVTITNLPARQLDDKTVVPRKWDVAGAVKYNFVAQDDSGVYRYADQRGEGGSPTVIKPYEYYLKYPIAERTSWTNTEKVGDGTLSTTLTLESITDTVTVPAGTFKDCLKIKQVGSGQFNDKAGTEISIDAFEWYAPKVGLVKSMAIIKKQAKGQPASTDSLTYELESFKQ